MGISLKLTRKKKKKKKGSVTGAVAGEFAASGEMGREGPSLATEKTKV